MHAGASFCPVHHRAKIVRAQALSLHAFRDGWPVNFGSGQAHKQPRMRAPERSSVSASHHIASWPLNSSSIDIAKDVLRDVKAKSVLSQRNFKQV